MAAAAIFNFTGNSNVHQKWSAVILSLQTDIVQVSVPVPEIPGCLCMGFADVLVYAITRTTKENCLVTHFRSPNFV